jgi:ABC-2 type transport system permease protein
LRVFAQWHPVSAVTQATRELFGTIPPGTAEPTARPLRTAVGYTLRCVAMAIAVFAAS